MMSEDILLFLGRLGFRFTRSEARLAHSYFYHMIKDGRVITIYKDGELHGLATISLCFDYIPYWKKKTWDYKQHDPNGTTLYVEILAARNWDKEARKAFAQTVLTQFPHIDQAIWHKWASWGDRKVIWRRQWAMK